MRSTGGTHDSPTDYEFTGQKKDSTGLMYYGARYYAPGLARFIQPDTIVPDPSNPQSLNRYSYVLNNPLKYTDPTGHDLFIVPGHGEGDDVWMNAEGVQRGFKEWIIAYKQWTERNGYDDLWTAFLKAWRDTRDDLSSRNALMAKYRIFVFNWNNVGGSTARNSEQAIDEVYSEIEQFGMKDITLIGHSKGATVVLGFLRKLSTFKFHNGEAPKNAVLLAVPETLVSALTGYAPIPHAVPRDSNVRTIQVWDPLDFGCFGCPPVGGAEVIRDETDEGGSLTGRHHDWKRGRAAEVLRYMLQVQFDQGAGP